MRHERRKAVLALVISGLIFTACSSAPSHKEQELAAQVTALNSQVTELSGKVKALSDQLDSTKVGAAVPTPVVEPVTSLRGAPVSADVAASDPEAGFVDDAAIQAYRKALILFQSEKYPDAALAFSGFLDKYPDHPLAGPAQFYVGESRFKQREYAAAEREFGKVLTSYDRSAFVAAALRDMAESEDHLKKPEDAGRHRQLLTSLFPQSPFAVLQPKSAAPVAAPISPAAQPTAATPSPSKMGEFDPPPTAPLNTPAEGAGAGP